MLILYTGGDIAFPQLARKLPYQPGDSLIFRGSELEHFVGPWTGYRVFQLFTNHQPVFNYVKNTIRKKQADGKEDELDKEYDPCVAEPTTPKDEALDEVDVHGAGYIPKRKLFGASSSTGSSSLSRGRVIGAGDDEEISHKKQRII